MNIKEAQETSKVLTDTVDSLNDLLERATDKGFTVELEAISVSKVGSSDRPVLRVTPRINPYLLTTED